MCSFQCLHYQPVFQKKQLALLPKMDILLRYLSKDLNLHGLFAEVGVLQNSSHVAQMRNLRCALCLFFSACAICVCESVNLIFVAL